MPNRIALSSISGLPRIVILLAHETDASVHAAMKAASKLSEAEHLSPIALIECTGSTATTNIEATEIKVLRKGKWEQRRLLDALHASGTVPQIDIVSVGTAALSNPGHSELFETSNKILAETWKAAPPNTKVALHYVWFPDHDDNDISLPANWLHSDVNSILVVLPEDRQHESAMAMPVSSSEIELHGWHVITELASIAGLWSTMRGAPLEFIKFVPTGIGEIAVRLVRSTSRLVRMKMPSLDDDGDETPGSLPVPQKLTASPAPFRAVDLVAPNLYPDAFRLNRLVEYVNPSPDLSKNLSDGSFKSLTLPGQIAFFDMLRNWLTGGDSIWDSKVRFKAFANTLKDLYPWSTPLIEYHTQKIEEAQNQPEESSEESSEEESSEAERHTLDSLRNLTFPELQENLPTKSWNELLELTLGVIDGSTTAADIRRLSGDEGYVLVDRMVLAPPDGDLESVLSRLENPCRKTSTEKSEYKSAKEYEHKSDTPSDTQSDKEHAFEDPFETARYSNTKNAQLFRAFKTTSKHNNTPSQSHTKRHDNLEKSQQKSLTISHTGNTYTQANRKSKTTNTKHSDDRNPETTADNKEQTIPTENKTLINAITTEFDSEISKGNDSILLHIKQLSSYFDSTNHPNIFISKYLKVFFGISILLLILLITTRISAISNVMSPDNLSPQVRMGMFSFFSTLATIPVALRYFSLVKSGAQSRLIIIVSTYITTLIACIIFAPQLSNNIDYAKYWWAPWIVIVTVLASLIASTLRPSQPVKRLLGFGAFLAAKKTSIAMLIVYIMLIVIAVLNLKTVHNFLDRGGIRLSVVLFSFTSTAFMVSIWLIQRTRKLRRESWKQWEQKCCNLLITAEKILHAQNMITSLRVHWLGTALVLTRLIHKPFGAYHKTRQINQVVSAQSPMRKTLTLDITLKEERAAFLNHAYLELAPPGWLTAQYQRMSEQYTTSEQKRTGNHNIPRPELCAYPVDLKRIKQGQFEGFRWPFAHKVYSRGFDTMLGDSVNQALSDALMKTFHQTSVSAVITTDEGRPKTLLEVFNELLPTTDNRMPGSVLPKKTHRPPEYEPMVWWPDHIRLNDHAADTKFPHKTWHSRYNAFTPKGTCNLVVEDDVTIFQAVRVDVSEPILANWLSPQTDHIETDLQPSSYDSIGYDEDTEQPEDSYLM